MSDGTWFWLVAAYLGKVAYQLSKTLTVMFEEWLCGIESEEGKGEVSAIVTKAF